jgi:hypothetical protein
MLRWSVGVVSLALFLACSVNAWARGGARTPITKPKTSAPKTATHQPKKTASQPRVSPTVPRIVSGQPKTPGAQPRMTAGQPRMSTGQPSASSSPSKLTLGKSRHSEWDTVVNGAQNIASGAQTSVQNFGGQISSAGKSVGGVVSGAVQQGAATVSGEVSHVNGVLSSSGNNLSNAHSLGQQLGKTAPPTSIQISPPKLPSGNGFPSMKGGGNVDIGQFMGGISGLEGPGPLATSIGEIPAVANQVVRQNPELQNILNWEQQEGHNVQQGFENYGKNFYNSFHHRPSQPTRSNGVRTNGSGGQQRPTNNSAPTETGGEVAIGSSPAPVNVSAPSSSSGQNPTVANQPTVGAAPTGNVAVTGVGLTDNQTVTAPQRSTDRGQEIRRSTGRLERTGQPDLRRPTSLSEFQAKFRAEEARRNNRSPGANDTQHEESNSAQQHRDAVDRFQKAMELRAKAARARQNRGTGSAQESTSQQ